MRQDQADLLRHLALSDDAALRSAMTGTTLEPNPLDPRTTALVRLAALTGLGAASASYVWVVTVALAVGVTEDELVAVLIAVAGTVGTDRLQAAANQLALALSHDLGDPATS
jgi:alkylhydroperoxidase/carboxymuconolactone decarboxylase family protein YurZ